MYVRSILYVSSTYLKYDVVENPEKIMLGEQIAELKGMITSQRVLDAEGPNMEISVSAKGSIRGHKLSIH